MRRSLIALSVISSLGLVACEDGPAQPYNPSPNGAGDKWNDGQSPPAADPATQGFGVQGGGTNKQEICNGPTKAMTWAKMVAAPILPPRKAAQLDMAGDDTWVGLTIEQAEQINCQSTNYGDLFGDGNQDNYWGDNYEVFVEYRTSNRKIIGMTLSPGYTGTLDLTSRDGKDTFKIPIQTQITKNGQPYALDWNDEAKFPDEVNELYDALTATYAPGLPAYVPSDPNTNCRLNGACIVGNFGDVAYIYWPALGSAIWVDNKNAPPPTPSIITRIDQDPTKTLPFSLSNPQLKLDAEGPVANAGKLGNAPAACVVKMGLTFDDFLGNCVKVTGDPAKDGTEYNKLLGGLTHGDERFHFDVRGVDINFTDKTLAPDDIVHDKDLPHGNDTATQFRSDQSTLGKITNDRLNNDPNQRKDLHGAGLVYLEYARLVQAELNKYVPAGNQHQLADPACTTAVDPSLEDYADGCTGFEGFIAPLDPSFLPPADPLLPLAQGAYDPTSKLINAQYLSTGITLGLKPGHPQVIFCLDLDPTGDIFNGYNYCNTGDIFATSYARVLHVMGKDKVANLPIDVQDIRFFWKQYFTAVVKYLKAAGSAGALGPNENVAGVHAQTIDPDNLFFDSVGSGQFEIGEYVDRRFVTATTDPTDLTVTADVKNGIFNDFTFSRDIFRGETALYSAVLEDPADPIGKEDTGLLTNLFGSPLLGSTWLPSSKGGKYTAYYCATHLEPKNCDGQYPPLDESGNLQIGPNGLPRLARYPGAFDGAATSFTLGATPITIDQTYPNIQSAMVNVPLFENPYDPSSTPLTPIQVLVPWFPKQPGEGFPIALTGTLDKFVSTAQLDFTGTTITANVDFDYAIDPATGQPAKDGSLEFKAVETTDYLGEVFLCYDPATSSLLGARMYTPVAEILDWLESHPGTYDSCGIIITYSPYGNYADYITSLTAGVRLGITQGGGFGRVVDTTLFVPGQ
jgi:hypothetical protein